MTAHAATRSRAAERRVPLAKTRARAARMAPPRDFFAALSAPGVRVIAEIKKSSPSRGALATRVDPGRIANAYESGGAAALSVLTEPKYFRGSLADMRAARAAVKIPVLRKDFIVSEYQIAESRAAGADSCLLIVALLGPARLRVFLRAARADGMEPLVEAEDARGIKIALRAGAKIIGINNRDLRTFRVDPRKALRLLPTKRARRGRVYV